MRRLCLLYCVGFSLLPKMTAAFSSTIGNNAISDSAEGAPLELFASSETVRDDDGNDHASDIDDGDDGDRAAVKKQLGYIPKNYVGVSARNAHSGEPIAIQTYPLMGGSRRRQTKAMTTEKISSLGAPFPTLYWLTCPTISKAIAELERQGQVARIEEVLGHDAELQGQLLRCHQEYALERWNSISSEDRALLEGDDHGLSRMKYMLQQSGIAGINTEKKQSSTGFPAVKCLHSHYAHYRSTIGSSISSSSGEDVEQGAPKTINPVGQFVHDRLVQDFPDLHQHLVLENGNQQRPHQNAEDHDNLQEQETSWCDARIRHVDDYQEAISAVDSDNDDDDDDSDSDFEASETFSFRFRLSSPNSADAGDKDEEIEIELKGCHEESNQIYKSTGLTVWRSARYMCDYLLQQSSELLENKRRILELGSGLGLVGIFSHLALSGKGDRSKTQVLLTDGDTDTLQQLRSNVQRNTKGFLGGTSQISCHQLLWGRDSARSFLKRQGIRSVDNQNNQDGDFFDLILASDVIYTPVVIEPLFETVQSLLHPGGVFVMAYESKRKIAVSLKDVLSTAESVGLKYECVDRDDSNGIYVWKFWFPQHQ